MAWFIDVEDDMGRSEQVSPPFETLADAALYAIDLAETLGTIAPFVPGRKVNIKTDTGRVQLSLTVVQGGLAGGGG